MFFQDVSEALTTIFSAKLRAVLAILGILVGTAAVVALMTSSQLATAHALSQFKHLGTRLLAVNLSDHSRAHGSRLSKKMSLSETHRIQSHFPQILEMVPYTYTFHPLIYRGVVHDSAVVGVIDNFSELTHLQLAQGRFVSLLDGNRPFAVIGSGLAERLAQAGLLNPLGHQLLLGRLFFTVVGVLKPWPSNWFVAVPVNDSVLIPLPAAYLLDNQTAINHILVKLSASADIVRMKAQLTKAIEHGLPDSRVSIRSPQQIVSLIRKQRSTFTWLLGAIGGISLLVGAIGVMNILLVSVIERQREIGIRLAVGARQRDILRMFLVESVLLTVFGGLLGVAVGLGFSYGFSLVSHWEFHWLLMPSLLGFSVSVLVGILSGLYPAFRASRLDPIISLRV